MMFARRDIFLLSLLFEVISHVSGSISVTCGFRYMFIYIEGRPPKMEFLHATGFYIGRRDSRCYADLHSRVIVSFPFRKCDMKVTLHEGGVVYTNTIFFDTKSGNAEKYAEFQCQYGTTGGEGIAMQSVKYNTPPARYFNGSLVRGVTLCNSLRYCPSRSCPTSLEFHDHTVFFAGNVMHMAIFTNAEASEIQDYPESVSAIEQLSMQCIDGSSSSSSTLRFRSVTDGCSAKQPFFGHDVTTVMTQINYNTQSSIICISVDVPPVNLCRRFVITGAVGRCVKLNEEICSDYSGSRCSGVEISEEFTLGPFYVTPKTQAKAFVKYVAASEESTTARNTPSVYEVDPTEYDRTAPYGEHTPTFREATTARENTTTIREATAAMRAHDMADNSISGISASTASVEATTAFRESMTVVGEANVVFGETAGVEITTVKGDFTDNATAGISQSTSYGRDQTAENAMPPRHIVSEPTPPYNSLTILDISTASHLQPNEELSFESNADTDGDGFLQSRNVIDQRKADVMHDIDSLTPDVTTTNYGRATEQIVRTTTDLHYVPETNGPEGRGEGSSEEFDVADSDTRMETGSTQDIRMAKDLTSGTRIDTGSTSKSFRREHLHKTSDIIPTKGAIYHPTLLAEISAAASTVQIQALRYDQNEDGEWVMFEKNRAENDLPPSRIDMRVIESSADFDVSLDKEVVQTIENIPDRNKLPGSPNYSTGESPEMRTVGIGDNRDLQVDSLASKTGDDDEISQESHSVSSRDRKSNAETPVTLTSRVLLTNSGNDQRNGSTVKESPLEKYLTTREPERGGSVETLEASNGGGGRAQKSKSALRHFDEYQANEGFIWAGVSAMGVFLLCSIALTAAWVGNRRKAQKRRREWVEVSSRL